MSLNWTLLLDADLSQPEWHYSLVTDATLLRIEQENVPRVGRFSIAQALPDRSEFIDIKGYPATADTTRLGLDYPDPAGRLIAVRHNYSEFADNAPNAWRVRVYGAKPEFVPPVNPSAILLTLDPRVAGAVPVGEKGIPFGVATLNEDGIVPDEQLPNSEWMELLGANLAATDNLAIRVDNLAAPTLESLGAEPRGAETRSRQYTDEKFGAIAFPPVPTLASLGAEPVGAEARARQYVDQRFPPVVAPTTDIRINCGATLDYTAADGKIWSKDVYFSFGNPDASYLGVVSGTYDFFLFNQSRSGGGGGGFNYKIPVPNGNYRIELGFSENFHANINSRRFHVDIEGIRVLTDFDIRAQAGARYTAIKRTFNTTVSDGELILNFIPTLDGAQVNNIRVYSA